MMIGAVRAASMGSPGMSMQAVSSVATWEMQLDI